MILLDTNMLSAERVAEINTTWNFPLFTSSVSAQEILGMRKPGGTGYRYALPDFGSPLVRKTVPPWLLQEWIEHHAQQFPVAKQTDRKIFPKSSLASESLELGHDAVAFAHDQGLDGVVREYASRAVNRSTLKRILAGWELLRADVESVIPLDDEILDRAAQLANQFVAAGYDAKGSVRNTLNDLLIAATSQVAALPLVSQDKQLMRFYREQGWTITESASMFKAAPQVNAVGRAEPESTSTPPRYLNRPQRIRFQIDYSRLPIQR